MFEAVNVLCGNQVTIVMLLTHGREVVLALSNQSNDRLRHVLASS